jgi:hypothetical protein
VLEGLGGADAVVAAVALVRALEAGGPAMAVTSSVVVDENKDEDTEVLVVAFRASDTADADMPPDRDAILVEIRLRGW